MVREICETKKIVNSRDLTASFGRFVIKRQLHTFVDR